MRISILRACPLSACVVIAGAIVAALVLAACSTPVQTPLADTAPTEAAAPPVPTCPASEPCPAVTPCPEGADCPSSVAAPFEADWLSSGHADASAEAFVHWNEDDPAVVPEDCARCHSGTGYEDFLGADGSTAFAVDAAQAVGSVINCVACHNEATRALTSVTFPSGNTLSGLGAEARCMQCHQGRASKETVDATITGAGVTDMDVVSADIRFTNIHYFAAAATEFGTQAMGGYEYDGQSYDIKFAHVNGMDTCVDCHDSHTLELKIDRCTQCHEDVTSVEDLKDVREMGSKVDYDGDGNTQEGIYYEIEGLRDMLYQAMQSYSKEISGANIAYSPDAYPYFLIDQNGNGVVDDDEATRDNAFTAWTGRLAKAAYNLHLSVKDPGAFAHGGKYVIELLYDSIADLNTALADPVDLTMAHRIDAGHFASSQEQWRHWDGDGEVSASCARCHSATGLPTYLTEGVNVSAPLSSGLACSTCHDVRSEDFSPRAVETVKFPSGAELDSGNPNSNICMTCHQGRESTVSVNRSIAGIGDDELIENQRFINVHYFAAGATLMGGDAQGAYQYPDQEYAGQRVHVQGAETCVDCHDPHGLSIDPAFCETCHKVEEPTAIRMSETDYDGDGNTTEGLAEEISTMTEMLYASMRDYAANVLETPIAYNGASYPYFFTDPNGDGVISADESETASAFTNWTPRLLKAAYNLQYVSKDPGAFAHNPDYIMQVLYDTLTNLGERISVDTTGMTRP